MATLARTRAAGNNCGDSLSNREPRLSAGFNAWIIVAAICLGTSCQPSGKVAPLPPHFSVLAADKVPLILVGQVLQDARPVATPETSEWNGRPMQLWKVRVRVEQVLQGNVSAKEVNIFYFVDMGMIESSDAPLRGGIYAHHSEIFFCKLMAVVSERSAMDGAIAFYGFALEVTSISRLTMGCLSKTRLSDFC